MVIPVRIRNLAIATVLTVLFGCGEPDSGLLLGTRLAVDPCRDGPDVFQPFSTSFDLLSWIHLVDESGTLELRRGHRVATESDLLVLQFTTLSATREAWAVSPDLPLPIDDSTIRVSLVLNRRCPDQVQPLVALTGQLFLDEFDLELGGRIAGRAEFDLHDARAADPASPAGEAMRLFFDMEVRRGPPHDAFTR